MNESVVSIGANDRLVGIYTQPAAETAGGSTSDLPTVVLLNAGLVQRSGPFRLVVEVARRLVQRGYPCLRLDLAGIGDSAMRTEHLPDPEGPAQDIGRALDFLQSRYAAGRFVLFGLCSGADQSHYLAVRDGRVVGVVALDGFAYPTFYHFYGRYLARVVRYPRHVCRSAVKKLRLSVLGRILPGSAGGEADDADALGHGREPGAAPSEGPAVTHSAGPKKLFRIFEREFPPREEVAAEIQRLVDRGVESLYVYSGGYTYYNHAGQFFENFPNLDRHPQVDVEYFPEADHTYLLLADRRRLIDRIEAWMTSRFPSRSRSRRESEQPVAVG